MNTQPNREETLFHAALLLPPAERTSYLAKECFGDAALRQRVEELIQAHLQASDFLEQHPTEIAQPGVETPAPEGRIRFGSGGTQRMERATEKPGDIIHHYKLLQKLGEGGCGVVFMAEQSEPVRRKVALKVIKLGMDTKEVVARFEAERQALAMMDHPNIAKVLDGGATNTGRPYFVMELVRGIPITQYCDENNLATPQRLDLFIKVCQAVQHAHQKGIIHRDLKPSNIMVTLHDGVPVPKVIDFGIAKATDQSLTDKTLFTELNAFMGTPAYTSPEQAEMSGLDIDTRADIYSLGVLLYELLTGKLPFNPDTLMKAGLDEMRRTIREVEPPRPSTRLSTVTNADLVTIAKHRGIEVAQLSKLLRGDLDWIVMKALEKDRTRRYDTANSFAQDIQRYLGNEAVLACPPSMAYVFTKLVRRHKLACVAVAAVTVTLIGGIVVSTSQAVRAIRAEREQSQLRNAAEKARAAESRQRQKAEDERGIARKNAYVANMLLAQAHWDNKNFARLVQVLAETADYPLRGFEWYYWYQQIHSELLLLKRDKHSANWLSFSPDGRRIAAGYGDTVSVLDASSAQELFASKAASQEFFTRFACSPDWQRIAVATFNGKVRVLDASSGRELASFGASTNQVESLAFAPDGQRLVIASGKVATVWDATGRGELLRLDHGDQIFSIACSLRGERIATGGLNGLIKVWDAPSGRELLTLERYTDWILCVAFSPGGERIITTDTYYPARIWDAASGRLLVTLSGHSQGISSAAFSLDGRRVITGSFDATARVWDAASGKELLTLRGHPKQIASVAFSPDGQRVATSSDDGIRVWDATGNRFPITMRADTGAVYSAAISMDGLRIVTGGDDATAIIWDAVRGQQILKLQGHSARIRLVAFSPNGRRVVTGSDDRTMRIWDAANGQELISRPFQTLCLAFSPDGSRIVLGDLASVKVLDASNGLELLALKGDYLQVHSVAYSPDGRRIVTGSQKQSKVWDASSGKELLSWPAHSSPVTSVAFSPDGKRILTASSDQTAKVWDAATGRELLALLGHTHFIYSAVFSSDGSRIVTGSLDQSAKVWDASSGRELLTLKGHSSYIISVGISTDHRRIFTASGDGTAKVWEAASPEQVAAWQK